MRSIIRLVYFVTRQRQCERTEPISKRSEGKKQIIFFVRFFIPCRLFFHELCAIAYRAMRLNIAWTFNEGNRQRLDSNAVCVYACVSRTEMCVTETGELLFRTKDSRDKEKTKWKMMEETRKIGMNKNKKATHKAYLYNVNRMKNFVFFEEKKPVQRLYWLD